MKQAHGAHQLGTGADASLVELQVVAAQTPVIAAADILSGVRQKQAVGALLIAALAVHLQGGHKVPGHLIGGARGIADHIHVAAGLLGVEAAVQRICRYITKVIPNDVGFGGLRQEGIDFADALKHLLHIAATGDGAGHGHVKVLDHGHIHEEIAEVQIPVVVDVDLDVVVKVIQGAL